MKNINIMKNILSFIKSNCGIGGISSVSRRFLVLLITLLSLGVGNVWGFNETYIVGDLLHDKGDYKWTDQSFPIGTSNGSGTGSTYMYIANGNYFKVRINGKPAGNNNSWDMTTNGTGSTFYKWDNNDPAAAHYTGSTGIVKFNCTSTTSDNPVINLTRPWIWIRHNWSNNGWSNKHMTDNGDGTYTLVDYYSGTQRAHVGPDADNKTTPDASFKDFDNDGDNAITLIGSPNTGDKCLFTFNSYWYRAAGQSSIGYVGALSVAKIYVVTFNMKGHGGSNYTEDIVCTSTNNQVVSRPSDPSETGYTFGGWFTDENCTSAYNFSSVVNTHRTLYAKWTPKEYTLTFNKNGEIWGDASADATKTRKIVFDQTYSSTYNSNQGAIPSMAVKNGYYFKGWYTEASGGSQVINASGVWQNVSGYTNSSKEWKRAENTTLYAQYGTPTISATFSPASVLPLGTVTVTPSFDHVPEGSSTLCYVLTTSDGSKMEIQPTWNPAEGNAVSFEAPVTPGTYSVIIRLFNAADHSCSDESTGLVSTYDHVASFTVEASNAVTVQYKCGDVELRPSTTIYATSTQTSGAVTAPEIPGLVFSRWTTGANVSFAGGSTAIDRTVSVNASAAGTLTAEYSQGPLFFKNTKNWNKVYVYFYNSTGYLFTKSDASEGTGSSSTWEDKNNGNNKPFISGPHEMTLLEGTDEVYYYDGEIPANTAAFAFTQEELSNQSYFAGTSTSNPCHVVRVAHSINPNKPMIVPVGDGALWNLNYARYYGHDEAPILMDWGYNLRGVFNNWSSTKNEFTSARLGDLSFTTTAYLDAANALYLWKVYNGNLGYGLSGTPTLTQASPTSSNLASYNADGYNLQVKSNIAGEYTFTLNYGIGTGSSNTNGESLVNMLLTNMKVTVTYPVEVGDFRLVYTGGTKPHPGNVVKKRSNGKDVVDMFVDAGQSGSLKVQSCTEVSASSVTWTALASCSAPTYATGVNFETILSTGGAGVYSFTIEQDDNGANPKITKVEKYTGRFYVRTNCVNDDKWNYKDSKDAHTMTYSEYSTTLTSPSKPFSHYFVKDIHGTSGSSVNIRFTVATENSEAITDTVIAGDADGDYKDTWHSENLTTTANVRFTYNQANNKIWRAYTIGPENDNYMVLRSGSGVYEYNNGVKGAASTAIKFNDMNNWVYQADVFADAGTYVKLTAFFNGVAQYIKGIDGNGVDNDDFTEDDAVLLLSSSKATTEHMRVTYDFKTDRMIIAWLPSNTIETEINLDADVILIRKHQDAGQSITISGSNKLKSVHTVYGVMQFDKDYLNDVTKSVYSRDLFWISFPFDVKLSDVFGFGTYGQHWIIEYYDGKERAQKGFWSDSQGFWKFVMPEERDTYVLKANQGYVLALDLDELGDGTHGSTESNVWANSVTSIYLYFPSSSTIGDLENIGSVTVPIDQNGYQCTINRHTQAEKDAHEDTDINKNRTVIDSYWHMIGVPSYADATRTSGLGNSQPTTTITDNVLYVYEWSPTTNLYTVHSTSDMTFDAMRSYMVQYNGNNITWNNVTAHNTSSIVARRKQKAEDVLFADFTLHLTQNEESQDHTYIRLTNKEETTANFDFNQDLTKQINSNNANIYTIIGGYLPAAGNCLPLSTTETTVIPMGVQINTAGEYTFAMPDGTNGIGVSLVDNETGVRTSLSATNYTVSLTAGKHNGRFALEISPIQNTPTGIEPSDVSYQPSEIRKIMIDGILYIVRDGKMYDARGTRVK